MIFSAYSSPNSMEVTFILKEIFPTWAVTIDIPG
jgi:hypothetical protein